MQQILLQISESQPSVTTNEFYFKTCSLTDLNLDRYLFTLVVVIGEEMKVPIILMSSYFTP